MNIELPKDAEGREIPLDVEFLYNANGESVKPYNFTFRRYDGFCWEMRLVGVQNSVYGPKSFYLTPPDSWEKLEEDVQRSGAGSSSWFCIYAGHGKSRHFALDEERTKLKRDVFGELTPNVYYCKKLHIFIDHLDSPNNPSSAAAGCYSFEKAGKR